MLYDNVEKLQIPLVSMTALPSKFCSTLLPWNLVVMYIFKGTQRLWILETLMKTFWVYWWQDLFGPCYVASRACYIGIPCRSPNCAVWPVYRDFACSLGTRQSCCSGCWGPLSGFLRFQAPPCRYWSTLISHDHLLWGLHFIWTKAT